VTKKIERADTHIEEFKIGLTKFMGSKPAPYAVRVDPETESGEPIVHTLKADAIPLSLMAIVGDAVHNLRSALDHIACALVWDTGSEPLKQVEFPILDGPIVTQKDEARFMTKVQGMRQDAIDAIRGIRPYKGGNDLLWRLHRFDVIDKHKMLVAALGNITAVNGLPPLEDQWNGDRWLGIPGAPLILKEGQQFTPKMLGTKVDKDSTFFAEVVFNQPNVAEGWPVVLALRQMRRQVFLTIGTIAHYLQT
jgi:hypothetical protein